MQSWLSKVEKRVFCKNLNYTVNNYSTNEIINYVPSFVKQVKYTFDYSLAKDPAAWLTQNVHLQNSMSPDTMKVLLQDLHRSLECALNI